MFHLPSLSLARVLGATAVAALLAAPLSAQEECVEFQGLNHCALGSATLTLGAQGLEVDGLGGSGADGVATLFPTTDTWTARYDVKDGDGAEDEDDGENGGAETFRIDFVSQGESIGNGTVRDVGHGLELSAGYTAGDADSTISVLVFNDGVFQGGQGGVGGGASALVIPGWQIRRFLRRLFRGDFRVAPGGNCELILTLSASTNLELPDGSVVTGNEIRLVEEVDPEGHYPYLGFDSVVVQSDGGSFVVQHEAVGGEL